MEYLIVCLAGVVASGLTLFSGFGLGTLLLPVFALFFPVELAIAATALVHLLNNLFKFALVGRHAAARVVVAFGLPALAASFAGAKMLLALSGMEPLAAYEWAGAERSILPVEIVIAALMLVFALLDLLPQFERLAFSRKWLPLGGVLSGFFGGLSGHQGALRSAFLIKSGLEPQAFIGTGVVIACLVDFARLFIYQEKLAGLSWSEHGGLLAAATAAAFLGAWGGARLMRKVTLRWIQRLVAVMLILIAAGIGSGMI